MTLLETDTLDAAQLEAILKLWNAEYPQRLGLASVTELEHYFTALKDQKHFLLTRNGVIQAWAFSFSRDSETWFAVIVDGACQGKGIGQQLIRRLQAGNPRLNGWVIDADTEPKADGTTYRSPLSFYLRYGFRSIPEVRLETDKLSAVKIMWTAAPRA